MGEKVSVFENGTQIYANGNDQEIVIKPTAEINDAWVMFELTDSTFLEARIVDRLELEILGQIDSVVSIAMIAKDTHGVVIDHELNDQEISISKQFGFVDTYSFYDFPEDIELKTLIGFNDLTSHGIVPPVFEEIFDFEEEHFKNRILEKTISGNNDTIIYNIEKIRLRKWRYDPDPVVTLMDTLNYNKLFIRSEYSRWKRLPYQFGYEDDFAGYFSLYLYDSQISIKEYYSYFYSQEEGCLEEAVGSGIFYELHYGKCRGMFFDDNSSSNFKKLVYYQKGTEEWGTPIDFDALDVNEVLLPNNSFKISPNPVGYNLKIESDYFKNENIIIELLDLNGRNLLKKKEWFNEKINLTLPRSFIGMMLLKISTPQGIYIEKIIK